MNQPKVIPVIGLLGGIASGKSFVGAELERLGCARVDADRIGHEVLQTPEVLNSLREEFGSNIFQTSGEIDRRQLAALVFGNDTESQERRRQLERIVHPAIHQRALEQIDELRKSANPPRAIIIDAPLLIEAGWTESCDYIFYIDTPDEVRLNRALARGWTAEQWRARESAQISLEQKRRTATHFISGNDDLQLLKKRLETLLNQMHE